MRKHEFTPIERYAIYEAFKRKCFYCKGVLGAGEMEIHHVVAEALQGNPREFARISKAVGLPLEFQINSYRNWVPCHRKCHKEWHEAAFDPLVIRIVLGRVATRQAAIQKYEAKGKSILQTRLPLDAFQRKDRKYFDQAAAKIANFMHDHNMESHRGAILYDPKTTAVFGNDGFEAGDDRRAKEEVAQFRWTLQSAGIKELGFALSEDKYSWCILFKSKEVEYFNRLIWDFYPAGASSSPYQQSQAFLKLNSFWHSPFNSARA